MLGSKGVQHGEHEDSSADVFNDVRLVHGVMIALSLMLAHAIFFAFVRTYPQMTDCFALLDDSAASTAEPRSRLYTGYVGELTCAQASELPMLLEQMQRALRDGRHAIGLFSYELGADLIGVAHAVSDWPLAQVLLFERCEQLSAEEVGRWLDKEAAKDKAPSGIAKLSPNVNEAEFGAAIEKIHAYIEAGDSYQVNYTYRLRFDAFGSPQALYRRLRERQSVPYGALVSLPDGRAVLSLSPELFIRHKNAELTARPMKGTAPATGDELTDAVRAQALAGDEKNRAENLMIVDLLRNDLGRISEFGSVRVPALHEVARYGGVLQMTSTITARLRADATLTDIFGAIFPCGSITGAPKRRSMQIINEVEPEARRLYTGAIGWFEAPNEPLTPALSHRRERGESGRDTPVPNFCLSVPIRTLALEAMNSDGMPNGVRKGEMGVGAGIVFDSAAVDEYAECLLKASFLSGLPQEFELFETMHVTEDGCSLLNQHLRRIRASALYFGFEFDEDEIRAAVEQACAGLPAGDHRMRLSIGNSGASSISVQTAPLQKLEEPVRVLLAPKPTRAGDLFLRHKTTVRQQYDAAWREAEKQGAFDMLFCNERGELTEGGRSSMFVKLNGRWFTPPLESGVLPGVMRAALLADPAWNASERRLTLDDLCAAEEVVVCNALRGAMRAVVD